METAGSTVLTIRSVKEKRMAAHHGTTSFAIAPYRINLLSQDVLQKECKTCKKILPLDEFYQKNRCIYGVSNICKECEILGVKKQQEKYKRSDRSNIIITEKRCYVCKEILDIKNFSMDSRGKDGFQKKCKECSSVIFHEWYEENAEEQRERSKQYKNASPESLEHHRKYCRQWRMENPGKMIAAVRRWKAEHPEQVQAWYEKTRGRRNALARRRRENNPAQFAEYDRRRRARKKNAAVCDLTVGQWEFIKEMNRFRCVYCEKKPDEITQDHIVALVCGGTHSMENILPACRSCNSKKGTKPPPRPVQPMLKLGIA